MTSPFPVSRIGATTWIGAQLRTAFCVFLGCVHAMSPGSVMSAEDDPAEDSPSARLLFREDWKTTPAELPITQDHVATKDLVLVLHGPGKQGLKKSHHDKPVDDPFYPLTAVEQIGLTDLQAGGGSKASSRVDWIAVWGDSAVASEAAVVFCERSRECMKQ